VLKVGIIGLGDIARKAYLPVISNLPVELHLYSRNAQVLQQVSATYRLDHVHNSLDSMLTSGVSGAFVHTSTSSHKEIVEHLLNNGVHVYVDKPVTDNYVSTKELFALAEKKNLLLSVGFNRRFAPAYSALKELQGISMIIMQKNRKELPADIRTFIFDDFIHVVDTLLNTFPFVVKTITAKGMKTGDTLYHVSVHLVSDSGAMAVGIMNRNSGTVEERLEVFTPTGKWVVDNVADVYLHRDKSILKQASNDWETTLHKRGFEQMIANFIEALSSGSPPIAAHPHPLLTHQICEEVVRQLNAA